MAKSYYLEDITEKQKENPRRFLAPTPEELDNLKEGDFVRLIYVLNVQNNDNCRDERMWVEILEINNEICKGYLTNQPVYINDLNIGDIVNFNKGHIASILIKPPFDENLKAIISLEAIKKKEINWILRGNISNEQDSGWQLFHGNEEDDYINNPENLTIITLDEALQIEPKLENVFSSNGNAFEWNEEQMDFAEVFDYSTPEE